MRKLTLTLSSLLTLLILGLTSWWVYTQAPEHFIWVATILGVSALIIIARNVQIIMQINKKLKKSKVENKKMAN